MLFAEKCSFSLSGLPQAPFLAEKLMFSPSGLPQAPFFAEKIFFHKFQRVDTMVDTNKRTTPICFLNFQLDSLRKLVFMFWNAAASEGRTSHTRLTNAMSLEKFNISDAMDSGTSFLHELHGVIDSVSPVENDGDFRPP